VTAALAVTPGQVPLVEADAGGGTGGRTSFPAIYGGGGGGRSEAGTAHDPRLVAADGGGGGGVSTSLDGGYRGGGGGSGSGPAGSASATATTGPRAEISYQAQRAITIGETAEPGTFTAAGDVIHSICTVPSTSHVTRHDITVGGTVIGPARCPAATPGPGNSMRCTARHAITREDAERGSITSAVPATGPDPEDKPATGEAEATAIVPVPATG